MPIEQAFFAIQIEEKIPLKQGLKLKCACLTYALTFIEEKIPLKQGLKLKHRRFIFIYLCDWREDSIKTRIETRISLV